jgi:PAS domain S-box-containing protein
MHCRISADFLHDWANPTWFEFTGGCLEEERGFAWVEKVHPQDRETLIAGPDRAFAAREPFSAEFRIRGRDGSYRWFLDRGVPVHRGGKFAGLVGSCMDVTETKAAGARLQLLEEKLESALELARAS